MTTSQTVRALALIIAAQARIAGMQEAQTGLDKGKTAA